MVKESRDKALHHERRDKLIWTLVILLALGGVVANAVFRDLAGLVRLVIGLGWLSGLGFLVGLTSLGKRLFCFITEAKEELLNVVWPSKDETTKVTGVVILLVGIASVVLWLLDTGLMKLIGCFAK